MAFLFHAPGLWLFYRQKLAPQLQRQNVLAAGATFLAMAVGFWSQGLWALGAAWAVGHVAWGAWLARALRG